MVKSVLVKQLGSTCNKIVTNPLPKPLDWFISFQYQRYDAYIIIFAGIHMMLWNNCRMSFSETIFGTCVANWKILPFEIGLIFRENWICVFYLLYFENRFETLREKLGSFPCWVYTLWVFLAFIKRKYLV